MAKKIMFIDDEPDLVKVTSLRLKKIGYEVCIVTTGEEALNAIKETPPDLIFLDLRLPQMSGDAVCKQLKSDEKLRQIPVILFTASMSNILEKVKEIKADDYLTKPFEPEELLNKIKKFIG
jgi:CheY-like chemotaxis protein